MFSDYFDKIEKEVRETLENVRLPSAQEVTEILEKSKSEEISLKERAKLLQSRHEELLREFVYSEFRKGKNILKHIGPLYISNICEIEECGYCDLSDDEKKLRTRLSLNVAGEEIKAAMKDGARVIEFTLSTDPYFTPEILAEYIQLAKKRLGDEPGSGVLLCSDYFTTEQYELLKDAGLWGIVQWDETLDKKSYEKWHPKGRKSDFYERINTHDKAIQAGLEVATGFLFGLSPHNHDVLMQIEKARYLGKKYGIKPFVFGTPRIQGSVPDKDYELALMVYKLAEPTIPRWLQTREKFELNLRNVVDEDVFTYRCGEVRPGGYSQKTNAASQFPVNEVDKQSCEAKLKELNFTINYAWII